MSCQSSPIRTITCLSAVVFSTGANAPGESDVFVLSPEAMNEIAPMLAGVRATVYVENATNNLCTEVVLQTTSDGQAWETISLEPGAVAGNRKVTLGWYSNVANFKRAVRFGVRASQNAGINVESPVKTPPPALAAAPRV